MWYPCTMEIENYVKVVSYPFMGSCHTYVSDHPHVQTLNDKILVILNTCTEMPSCKQYIRENNQLMVDWRQPSKLHPMQITGYMVVAPFYH